MSEVQYRDIPGFEGYRVGDDGSVWTRRERFYPKGLGRGVRYKLGEIWTELKRSKQGGGYLEVQLWKNGKSYHKLIHRLVLEVFVGPCPEGMECRHFPDNNRENCRLENLSWATKKTNQNDRIFHGTHTRGERHGIASMTNETAEKVRERFKKLGNMAAIAREFGLSRDVVSRAVSGKTYRG